MKPWALPKTILLTKPWQYQKVYRQGKRIRGQEFSLICLPNGKEVTRLGISIHGVKQAVRRNRIKRIIREFFRHNQTFILPPSDVVFAVRPGFSLNSPAAIKDAVKKLIESADRRKHPKTRGR